MQQAAELLSPAFGPRLQFSRLTLRLALFIALVGVVLNLVLAGVFKVEMTLHATFALAAWRPGVDSWDAMYAALQLLQKPGHPPLYHAVFQELQNKFQYPLTSLLLIKNLMHLPYDPAARSLNIVSWFATVGAAIATGFILLRSVDLSFPDYAKSGRVERLLMIGVGTIGALTFYPLVNSFPLGQIQAWLDCAFCLAVLAWMYKRRGLAGLLTCVICFVKPQLTILLIWAAVRREWRYFWFFAIPYGVVSLVTLIVYGLPDNLDYLKFLADTASRGETFYANQSVNGLLNRLLDNGNNLLWLPGAFAPPNVWVSWGTSLSTVALIAVALFWRSREYARAPLVDFLIATLTFTIASPIAWVHHYGIMTAMFAVALPMTLAAPRLGVGSILLLAVSYFLSCNFWKFSDGFADAPFNFLQSYLFFGALLLLVQLYRLRHAQSQPAGSNARPLGTPAA
jgi:alpha-1,2-mannosyltransferase